MISDNVICELKILAKNDIRKKEIWDYYMDFLKNMRKWWEKEIKISI